MAIVKEIGEKHIEFEEAVWFTQEAIRRIQAKGVKSRQTWHFSQLFNIKTAKSISGTDRQAIREDEASLPQQPCRIKKNVGQAQLTGLPTVVLARVKMWAVSGLGCFTSDYDWTSSCRSWILIFAILPPTSSLSTAYPLAEILHFSQRCLVQLPLQTTHPTC